MRSHFLLPLLLILSPAYSADFAHSQRGMLFGGITYMQLQMKDATNRAQAIGGTVNFPIYRFEHRGLISIDSFFSRTIEAALDEKGYKADVNNAAFMLAYRSAARFYAIGKAGVYLSNMDYNGSQFEEDNQKLGLSVGAGFEILPSIDIEVDYNRAEQDFSIWRLNLLFSE